MPARGRLVGLSCLLMIVGFCGLACNNTESLNPVHGKVTYQGQPLAGALVSFHPDGATRDPAVGLTKDDGTFSLTTGEVNGAQAGKYIVTVMCQVPAKDQPKGMSFGGTPETEDKLKGAYANAKSSQIKVEIKNGPNQLQPIDLK